MIRAGFLNVLCLTRELNVDTVVRDGCSPKLAARSELRPDKGGSVQFREILMTHDTDKIDKAVLALFQLGLHDENRTWKTFDWEVMNRLYEKGLISNPVGKTKSVQLTERGLVESRRLFTDLFDG
jgi:hypothetical protein